MQGGADAILIPSRFEPCGLTQLCGLRYGCVPVVARVGGLADTVIDANDRRAERRRRHRRPVPAGRRRRRCATRIRRAVALYAPARRVWTAMQRQGMAADVSWDRSAGLYAELYASLLPKTGRMIDMTRPSRPRPIPTRSPAPRACARRCRTSSSRTMSRTSSSRSSTASKASRQDAGDRRRRAVLQPRGHPDRAEDGGGQRLRPGAGRPGRHPLDAGRLATSSASTRRSAASSCRPATIPAGRPRTSASSTTSATAARRRRRSPRRSSPGPRRSTSTASLDAPDLDLDKVGAHDARRHDRRGDRPGRRLRRADGDAVRLPGDPGDVRRRLPHGFDAMHAVTGPYATEILEAPARRARGHGAGTARRSPDFGGHHPDPNLVHAKDALRRDDGAGCAGFRRRLRRRRRPQPHHRHAASSSRRRTRWPCSRRTPISRRATPTGSRASPARCRRAPPPTGSPRSSASACYETPTGWKFFGNLLDAGLATICGEESAGTGSNHVREKDGLWAVLLWLNILAGAQAAGQGDRRGALARSTAATTMPGTTTRAIDTEAANGLMDALRGEVPACPGTQVGGSRSPRPTTSPITTRWTARPRRTRASASCSRAAAASSSACRAPAPRGRRCASTSSATSRPSGKLDIDRSPTRSPISSPRPRRSPG